MLVGSLDINFCDLKVTMSCTVEQLRKWVLLLCLLHVDQYGSQKQDIQKTEAYIKGRMGGLNTLSLSWR